MTESVRTFKSEKKEADLQQKSDDPLNYGIIMDIFRKCNWRCDNSPSRDECLKQCYQESPFYSLELSEPHSQISEKLADSAKILFDESEKLSLIAEEMHSQDLMYL